MSMTEQQAEWEASGQAAGYVAYAQHLDTWVYGPADDVPRDMWGLTATDADPAAYSRDGDPTVELLGPVRTTPDAARRDGQPGDHVAVLLRSARPWVDGRLDAHHERHVGFAVLIDTGARLARGRVYQLRQDAKRVRGRGQLVELVTVGAV